MGDKKNIVAAIDFGTSRCGLSYCLQRDPTNCIVVGDWPEEKGMQKAKTALQMDRDGKMIAFGQQAINSFLGGDMSEGNTYLSMFKMKLYEVNDDRSTLSAKQRNHLGGFDDIQVPSVGVLTTVFQVGIIIRSRK